MRRLLLYWAATVVLYAFCCFIVWRTWRAGAISKGQSEAFIGFALLGVVAFYVLLRSRLKIPNWKLALFQALFAIISTLALYVLLEPMRGAILIGMPVVTVFCSLALRPRQSAWLGVFAITALGATSTALTVLDPLRYPAAVEVVHFILATIGVVSVTAITGELSRLRSRLGRQKAELEEAVATIRKLATTDELTLLSNRRHMNVLLAEEERRRDLCGQSICLAVLDVDFFKTINDRYGHSAGDAALRIFAREAGDALRCSDTLARWGGEEFMLLMPDTRLDDAVVVIERIAERIGTVRLPEVDPELRITFSAGVVACLPQERLADAIRRSDEAMYRAKADGRNRIVVGQENG